MASESSTTNTTFEDVMLTLFALLLVGQMAQRAPELLKERFNVDLEANTYLVAGASLDADTPVGTRVNVPNGSTYYDVPNGKSTGTFGPGTALTVVGGPETVDGERWWRVKDSESGKSGWVRESNLIREGTGGIGPATRLGSKARSLLDTNVWESPGSLVKAGIVKMGDWGTLTKGPKEKNGSRWWFFDRDKSGDDGWLPEAALLLASDSGWKEGTKVRSTQTTDIFERAGSGQIVGYFEKGEKAKILGGPVEVQGQFWWLIETEDGERGWVRESDLESMGVKSWIKRIISIIVIISILFILVLLVGIVYVTIRTNQIRAKEKKRIAAAIPEDIEQRKNERWEKILSHIVSSNPNDWRLAIIEADVLLDEVVTKMGYPGDGLGNKLKGVARGDFESIDEAWEAHKIRNLIAHSGSDYILTQREAKRVIDLYTKVFTEFKII
ncbi:SH3 domain-containing protein [Crocinitomicaceae bacterium]|nr:SH3 domain-containing protein [Crocinitomicaceae bacterium]